jgi:hypothetical protein
MDKNIVKAMMHPIRIKIIQDLGLEKTATSKELLGSCGDCAQATLYRHIKDLLKYKIIKIESTNQVNGITENVYALSDDLSGKIIKDPKDMTKEDYLVLFTQYIMGIMSNFSSYFEQDDAIMNAPHSIGFSTSTMLLSDDEFNEMNKELSDVVLKRLKNEPSQDRKMRTLSIILTTTSGGNINLKEK